MEGGLVKTITLKELEDAIESQKEFYKEWLTEGVIGEEEYRARMSTLGAVLNHATMISADRPWRTA